MAFDPKVAAGGVAVVAIGGGAGVAIHQGTTSSSQDQTSKKSEIELAIENAGFTLKKTEEQCIKALKETLSEDNYKAAVVACAAEDTFKKRTEKLNLEVLDETKITTEGTEKTKGESKGTNNSTIIKTLKNETELNDLATAAPKIKNFCEQSHRINTNTKTSDGYKYLKICVKEDEATGKKPLAEALTKDFGHNQTTMGAKMKAAKFKDKTNKGNDKCQEEKVNSPYKTEGYKELVIECSELSNFKARAEELELTVYPDTGEENFLKDEGNNVKDRVSVAANLSETEKATGEAAKSKVGTFCKGSDGNTKTIDKNTTNESGKKYLNICTKDKNGKSKTAEIVAKDFGTGETTESN